MKKKIIITACLLSLVSSSALCGSSSPYPERTDKDETRAFTGQLPYHMMLYEKSEEEAQEQYGTIVDSPDTESSAPNNEITSDNAENTGIKVAE